jgi:hypothetical protein
VFEPVELQAALRRIEHGTDLDAEARDAMRESAATLVPTCTVAREYLEADVLPPSTRTKLAVIADRHATAPLRWPTTAA